MSQGCTVCLAILRKVPQKEELSCSKCHCVPRQKNEGSLVISSWSLWVVLQFLRITWGLLIWKPLPATLREPRGELKRSILHSLDSMTYPSPLTSFRGWYYPPTIGPYPLRVTAITKSTMINKTYLFLIPQSKARKLPGRAPACWRKPRECPSWMPKTHLAFCVVKRSTCHSWCWRSSQKMAVVSTLGEHPVGEHPGRPPALFTQSTFTLP